MRGKAGRLLGTSIAAGGAVGLMTAAASIGAGQDAFAQDRADRDPSAGRTIDAIVVTAEKREQSLQDVPASITVLTDMNLQQTGTKSFIDYALDVPSLSFTSQGPGEQLIVIRGVSDQVEGLDGAAQKTTGVYIDEMVVSNNIASPDLNLFDINRVEVLRGPQGTLYGDGSIGGVVRIITNKPDASAFDAAVESTVSTTRKGGVNYDLNAMVNGPIIKDKLAVRLVGYYRNNEGFIDDLFRQEDNVNDEETFGGRVSVRLSLTDSFTLTGNALYQSLDIGGRSEYEPVEGDLNVTRLNAEPIKTKFQQYNLTAEWDIGFATLTSATSYSDYDRVQKTDFTDIVQGLLGAPLSSVGRLADDVQVFSRKFDLPQRMDRTALIGWSAAISLGSKMSTMRTILPRV